MTYVVDCRTAERGDCMRFGIGQPVPRTEDQRLLTGAGRYVADVSLDNQAVAYVLRSPHAHAKIVGIDAEAARNMPGVLAVLTGSDFAKSGIGTLPTQLTELDVASLCVRRGPSIPPNSILAERVARCVGDPIAFVVAETLERARDAAESVIVEYDPLPAVVDPREAVAPQAPAVWPAIADNICLDSEYGDESAVRRAFDGATYRVSIELENQRVAVASLETRGAVGQYDRDSDTLTLIAGLQGVSRPRMVLAKDVFHMPVERVRVISHDVGGGFGMKSALYPEYIMALWAAKILGRPVKWVADRSEAFLSDSQGRDNRTCAELAIDSQGRFLALRVDTLANLGAYPGLMNPIVPHVIGPATAMGVYRTPCVHHRIRTVFTNTVFVGPYRGAGRPEAAYVMERLADLAGLETGLGAVEIRRRNFVPKDHMPWTTPIGPTYDSGDFTSVFEQVLKLADVEGFADRREQSRRAGRLRGLGFSAYIESAGGKPADWGELEVDPDHVVVLRIGTHNHGQGHETSFAQVVAEKLQVPFESIQVRCADSGDLKGGSGTHASRSMRVAGAIITTTAETLLQRAQKIAGHLLEVEEADMVYRNGLFFVDGTDRGISIFAVARAALENTVVPPELQGPLAAEHAYQSHELTFPNGCHVCELEVDADTGAVAVVSYVAVDDVGRVINPMIVEGQVHGGVAQGLGQALFERCVYDHMSGQLITGSFADYAIPRAADMPLIKTGFHEVPTTTNPLGVKGAGEGGATAAPPAIVNAVVNALAELGVRHIDMPLTSEKVWRLLSQQT